MSPDSEAPLSQWESGSAHDTAAECESARSRWQSMASAELAALPLGSPEDSFERRYLNLRRATWGGTIFFARCVASDDPRLAKSPPRLVTEPPPTSIETPPVTPAFTRAVGACRSIVRAQTDNQYARAGITIVQSNFDAFVTPDGRVSFLGTSTENFAFQRCMNEMGHPLTAR
jgi:hypothetical protein